jgi:tRNA threonylcarbamoyladenosine biosynthesis protein TsaB
MSLILSIETSTPVGSVALHQDGILLTTSEIHIPQTHASKLAVLIDQVLGNAGVSAKKLDAVAMTSGPGSYTGLRIGTSTAKGLCFALEIPLIAVGSLELMAYQVAKQSGEDTLLCPMIDARRMEVYCILANHSLGIIQPIQPIVIDENSFSDYLLKGKILFFGNGASKCMEVIGNNNAVYLDGINPLATHLGEMAFQKYQQKAFEDLINFEPNYLKEFLIKPAKAVL